MCDCDLVEWPSKVAYNMEDVFESCLTLYSEFIGPRTTSKPCSTPFHGRRPPRAPAGTFGVGLVVLCLWSHHTVSPKSVVPWPTLDKMPAKRSCHIDCVDEVAASAVLSLSERKSPQAGADLGAPRSASASIDDQDVGR